MPAAAGHAAPRPRDGPCRTPAGAARPPGSGRRRAPTARPRPAAGTARPPSARRAAECRRDRTGPGPPTGRWARGSRSAQPTARRSREPQPAAEPRTHAACARRSPLLRVDDVPVRGPRIPRNRSRRQAGANPVSLATPGRAASKTPAVAQENCFDAADAWRGAQAAPGARGAPAGPAVPPRRLPWPFRSALGRAIASNAARASCPCVARPSWPCWGHFQLRHGQDARGTHGRDGHATGRCDCPGALGGRRSSIAVLLSRSARRAGGTGACTARPGRCGPGRRARRGQTCRVAGGRPGRAPVGRCGAWRRTPR